MGNVFDDKDAIKWTSEQQAMKVMNLNTKRVIVLAAKALKKKKGAVQFFRGCLPCDNYPNIVHKRYMKNGTSATPCTCALKPLIFEFSDSAEAFECLSLK